MKTSPIVCPANVTITFKQDAPPVDKVARKMVEDVLVREVQRAVTIWEYSR